MLQTAGHSLRADFARVLAKKFGLARLAVVGLPQGERDRQLEHAGKMAITCASAAELRTLLPQNGDAPTLDAAVWIYPKAESEDESEVAALAGVADTIVLVPGNGAEAAQRRPRLVESFRKHGLVPDYDYDLTDLDNGASAPGCASAD